MSIHNSSSNSLEERKKHFIERLNEKYPNFEYVSGYINSDGWVNIRCKKCGTIKLVKAQMIRGKKNTVCNECIDRERNINKQIKKMLRQQRLSIIQIQTERRKEIRELYRKLKDNTIYINKCVRCNEEYIGKSVSKYCPKCRHRIRDKHSNKSLKKLYERDKGICKICNGLCNWNDKKVINGTTVVGNTYPSIDHIIPLAKGGSDDWENLQLVHFKCNWLKGAC